jgi:hypothetical protein
MSKFISLSEAETMTHAFQDSKLGENQTISCSCDEASIKELLNQPGCEGARFYFSLSALSKLTLVVVGTDNDGNDMTAGKILNKLEPCPPVCPPKPSPLA